MIFSVYEPYNDDNDDINDNICFICFEKISAKGYLPIQLKSQEIYISTCICDGNIHKECLKSWISFNKSCPICRNKFIEKNNCTIILFNYIPYGIYIYLFITKKINLVKITSILILIYLILDIYFFYFKYKRYYKDVPINSEMINNLDFNTNKITYYNITFNDIIFYDIIFDNDVLNST